MGPLGGDEVRRVEPHDRISALIRGEREGQLSQPCEDAARRQLFISQEVCLLDTRSASALILDFQAFRTVRNKMFIV